MSFRRPSLLSKLWLSTSVALTVLFAITGYVVQRHAIETTWRNLEEEVKASFQAYESLWRARAESLRTISSILSSMPHVRAAFGTGDAATIRDTAGELWTRISDELKESAVFLVADPQGRLIASLGEAPPSGLPREWPVVRAAVARFPGQAWGFYRHGDELFQFVLTPVYVDSPRGPVLINVLVAGYQVNHVIAQRLKESTGGSEFVFLSQGRVFASTLNERATAVLGRHVAGGDTPDQVSDGVQEYSVLVRELIDLEGKPAGRLCIFRSFEGARQRIAALRTDVIMMWLLSMTAGLAVTYWLARRIIGPVTKLDRAAAEVARQNYDYRVTVDSSDELGRLASTFNSMCTSLQAARAELIRQERISTIGRLAGSIVHDLRNPLAAIYGGSEMLVDTELPPSQVKRLAASIYRASRRIQKLLHDLANVSRGKTEAVEVCRLRDVVEAAADSVAPTAEEQSVRIEIRVPGEVELPLERARMERVFLNLIVNALEAMPDGGEIRITAERLEGVVRFVVADTGPGISPEIRDRLFQPFVSFGKKSGLGLGLALSRQTVLDHGGDMWVESGAPRGARFVLTLPLAPVAAGAPTNGAATIRER